MLKHTPQIIKHPSNQDQQTTLQIQHTDCKAAGLHTGDKTSRSNQAQTYNLQIAS